MTGTDEVYNVPRGTAYLTSQQVVQYTGYLVFYILLARILTLTEVGEVTALLLVQGVFTGIISGSLPLAATRFISRSVATRDLEGAAGVARVTIRMSLAVAGPGLVIAIILSPIISGFLGGIPNSNTLLLVTLFTGFFLDLMLLYTSFFLGIGKYAQTFYQSALYVPLSRGLALALAYAGFRLYGIVIGWVIGAIAALLLSIYLWHGKLPKGRAYPVKPILAFALPVFASALITLGQQWGDVGIIYALLGPTTLAPYYYAVSSVTFLSILWMPVNQAIYPALSADHVSGTHKEASERLATSFRLINLTVLPISAALAAISSTALDVVYGPQYMKEALTLSILSLASIFVAEGVLLVTVLQAVGHTRKYLEITLTSTLIFIGFVALLATPFQTLAGALGRVLLSLLIVLMARFSLRHVIDTHVFAAMRKALPLAAGVAIPLYLLDYFFGVSHIIRPLFQLIVLFGVFIILYGAISRQLNVFHHGDFAMLHDVLPSDLRPLLKRVQRFIVSSDE